MRSFGNWGRQQFLSLHGHAPNDHTSGDFRRFRAAYTGLVKILRDLHVELGMRSGRMVRVCDRAAPVKQSGQGENAGVQHIVGFLHPVIQAGLSSGGTRSLLDGQMVVAGGRNLPGNGPIRHLFDMCRLRYTGEVGCRTPCKEQDAGRRKKWSK